MKDLGSKSLTAVFWGGGGSVLKILLQIGSQIVLARALGPEQYGLFAIGAIVVGFSNFFSDIGIAYGLIQKDQVTDADLRFVFTWQLILGLLVTLLIAVLSKSIAELLGNRSAWWVIASLSVVCLINAVTAPSNNMLKRNLDFRRIQIASIASYVFGYILIGIPLALLTGSVVALVVAWIAQSLATLVILYSANRHSLRLQLWFDDARAMVHYGATVFATNMVNWFIGNIDRVIIARYFPGRTVGLYATTYNLIYSPVASLMGILQPVFFSSGARMAEDPQRVARNYLAIVGLLAIFLVPVFATVAAVSDTFVVALYGQSWFDAGVLLTPIALAMPVFLLWGLTTPLLWLSGRPGIEFKMQLPMALLWIGIAFMPAKYSVATVAWAVLALFTIRLVATLVVVMRLTQLSWADMTRATQGGLVLAAACSGAAYWADATLLPPSLPAVVRLALVAFVAAGMQMLALVVFPRLMSPDCCPVLDQLAPRLSPTLARYCRQFSLRVSR